MPFPVLFLATQLSFPVPTTHTYQITLDPASRTFIMDDNPPLSVVIVVHAATSAYLQDNRTGKTLATLEHGKLKLAPGATAEQVLTLILTEHTAR